MSDRIGQKQQGRRPTTVPLPANEKGTRVRLAAILVAGTLLGGTSWLIWRQPGASSPSGGEATSDTQLKPNARPVPVVVARSPAAPESDQPLALEEPDISPQPDVGESSAGESKELPELASVAEVLTQHSQSKLEEQQRALDPQKDGWDTEDLNQQAEDQLRALADLLGDPANLKPAQLEPLLAAPFSCGSLRPTNLTPVYRDQVFSVSRSTSDDQSGPVVQAGAAGLHAACEELMAPFGDSPQVRVKFKQFRIKPEPESFWTTAFFHASATVESGPLEQNATWRCHWQYGSGENPPRLLTIQVDDYEEVAADRKQGALFAEHTEAVLGSEAGYHDQLRPGIDYWKERLDKRLVNPFQGQVGLAVGDVNGDGLDDVYFCQQGGLPNRLFVQRADGTAADISRESGLDVLNFTRAALLVDLDNDGDQDLVAATFEQLLIFANDGRAKFELVVQIKEAAGGMSLAAADYDADADLDLFVCRYYGDGDDVAKFPTPVPYHDANNGGRNFLLRNDGSWRFEDVTAEVGLDTDNRRFSFAATWEDYDNDGDPDLYVANDFGRNCLYRNHLSEGGGFVNAAAAAGLEDTAFGMSVSWGDYNRDGFMDVYVGNMFSAAGNRVTFQRQFKESSTDHTRADIQRAARGNSLFEGGPDGKFRDVSSAAAVTMGRWSWGSLFADINNDGWEDLLVTNGYITGAQPDDL